MVVKNLFSALDALSVPKWASCPLQAEPWIVPSTDGVLRPERVETTKSQGARRWQRILQGDDASQ
jgi:hypothetical protein